MEFLGTMYDPTAISRIEKVATTPFKRVSYTEAVQILIQVS